jgi:N-glycosylase/DNA lyase
MTWKIKIVFSVKHTSAQPPAINPSNLRKRPLEYAMKLSTPLQKRIEQLSCSCTVHSRPQEGWSYIPGRAETYSERRNKDYSICDTEHKGFFSY